MNADWSAYDVTTSSGQTVHVYFVGSKGRQNLSIPEYAELSLPFAPGQNQTPMHRHKGAWSSAEEAALEIQNAAESFVNGLAS